MASQAYPSSDSLLRSRVDNFLNYFDGLNVSDVDAALSGFADDLTWYGVDSEMKRKTWCGKTAVRDYLNGFFGTKQNPGSVPPLHYEVLHVASVDDTVMIEWKDWSRAAGNTYSNQGVMVADYAPGEAIVKAIRSFFYFGPMVQLDSRWRKKLSDLEK